MPFKSAATLCLLTALAWAPAAMASPISAPSESSATIQHARGPFEVKMAAQEQDAGDGSILGRMSLDKVFHGDFEATGKGQMLTATTDTPGSAVYVAIERVTGTLQGKAGSFALVHQGMMRGADRKLTVDIVPDSGAGALKGIAGRLNIQIVDGKHLYDLEYSLPGQ